jgi:hypothetical protein
LWIVVGQGSGIAYSTNGTSWTAATSVGGINEGRGILYGNGIWVVGGNGSGIVTSKNGTDWTEVPLANRGGIENLYGAAFTL